MGFYKSLTLPSAEETLPGRPRPSAVPDRHPVLGVPLRPPFPAHLGDLYLGMGCFWGAERAFWTTPGVHCTAVGYAGGHTRNPTYGEVCSGLTGHAEVVRVIYDPAQLSVEELLRVFWERHDPTQLMRQGNDRGTQYRSALYWTTEAQRDAAERSRAAYQHALSAADRGQVVTEIAPAGAFYYAEADHQQYLHKNPTGYCGLEGTGVSCPTGPRT